MSAASDQQSVSTNFPESAIWRKLLSGDRARIGQAAVQVKAAGHSDEYAALLLVVRHRDASRLRRLFGVITYRSAYTERERRSALTALSLLWGTMGRELGIALDPKATHFERQHAHKALSRRRDQRAVRPLIDALLSGHALEDWQCISTLGALGDQHAVDGLLSYIGLQESDSYTGDKAVLDVGVEIGRALRILNARAVLPTVKKMLHSAIPAQRTGAALVLAGWGQDIVTPTLIELLDDPVAGVRAGAATALGELKAVSALSPLQAHLTDPDQEVRVAVERAVQQVSVVTAQRLVSGKKLKRPDPVWR